MNRGRPRVSEESRGGKAQLRRIRRLDRGVDPGDCLMGGATAIEILVLTYNRSALLPATLETLLSQTVPAKSIRVVDNGSTDRTCEIVRSSRRAA